MYRIAEYCHKNFFYYLLSLLNFKINFNDLDLTSKKIDRIYFIENS